MKRFVTSLVPTSFCLGVSLLFLGLLLVPDSNAFGAGAAIDSCSLRRIYLFNGL